MIVSLENYNAIINKIKNEKIRISKIRYLAFTITITVILLKIEFN